MIRTKAFILREISHLKRQKTKLSGELTIIKAYDKIGEDGLKEAMVLLEKEINDTEVKIQTLYWWANTSEKQLPKLKKKKKKKKVSKEEKKVND